MQVLLFRHKAGLAADSRYDPVCCPSVHPCVLNVSNNVNLYQILEQLRQWALHSGFDAVSVSDIDLGVAEQGLRQWLAAGFHGEMSYMASHGAKRARPAELVPGTVRVISLRMNYLAPATPAHEVLNNDRLAYVSRYALGRDYHKVLRKRLAEVAEKLAAAVSHHYRVFTDSAPVLEVALADKGGLGWRGKHSLLLNRDGGSFFFIGEIFTDLPLPVTPSVASHCGRCRACIDVCPTGAIVAPYTVDARRCISYLTIEYRGVIDEALRPLMGNRIYGCDDCQLVCPWNRFARLSREKDFMPRHGLDNSSLLALFAWDETQFTANMAGSPVYRIGYEQWQRNIAVALGNARPDTAIIAALRARLPTASELLKVHIVWALQRQCGKNSVE